MKILVPILFIALFVYSFSFSGCSKLTNTFSSKDKICLDRDSVEKVIEMQEEMAKNHDIFMSEDSLHSFFYLILHGYLIDTNLYAVISKKDLEADPEQLESQINKYKKKCNSLEKELSKLKSNH